MGSGRRRTIALSQYVARRNGIPLGAKGSLTAMLRRSLGAATFAGFWRYWNPIWGYYLSRYVDQPLRRVLPAGVAITLTFAASGLVHDVAIMAVTRSVTFLFVPWFTAVGLLVVGTSAVDLRYGNLPWAGRAVVNVGLVLVGLGIALGARRVVGVI